MQSSGIRPGASGWHGGLWMVAAALMLSSGDAIAKQLTALYPVPMILWVRYLMQLALLTLIFAPRLGQVLATGRPLIQIGRGALLVVQIGVFYLGLRSVPLADATAVLFAAPLVVTALSFPVLGERVTPAMWAAVLLGFAGALLIVRPGADAFQGATLLPLLAALLFGVYQLATRLLGRAEQAVTTLFYTVLTGAAMLSAVVPLVWVTPAPAHLPLLAATGALSVAGHFCMIKAFEAAPAAAVAPLGYTGLVWAALYGLLLFGEVPSAWTVIGAGLIVVSGLRVVLPAGAWSRAWRRS